MDFISKKKLFGLLNSPKTVSVNSFSLKDAIIAVEARNTYLQEELQKQQQTILKFIASFNEIIKEELTNFVAQIKKELLSKKEEVEQLSEILEEKDDYIDELHFEIEDKQRIIEYLENELLVVQSVVRKREQAKHHPCQERKTWTMATIFTLRIGVDALNFLGDNFRDNT